MWESNPRGAPFYRHLLAVGRGFTDPNGNCTRNLLWVPLCRIMGGPHIPDLWDIWEAEHPRARVPRSTAFVGGRAGLCPPHSHTVRLGETLRHARPYNTRSLQSVAGAPFYRPWLAVGRGYTPCRPEQKGRPQAAHRSTYHYPRSTALVILSEDGEKHRCLSRRT